MPEAMRFEEYNWVAIRKFFRKSGYSRKATCQRFKLTTYMFDKAVRMGEIKLPKDWHCKRFVVGNHPAKGVGCDIQKMLISPKGQKMTYAEIGAKFECTPINVIYHAHALGLPNRKNQPPAHYERDWNEVQQYLDQVQNLKRVSEKFGISVNVINRRFERGVLTRPAGIGDPANRPGRGPDTRPRARRSS